MPEIGKSENISISLGTIGSGDNNRGLARKFELAFTPESYKKMLAAVKRDGFELMYASKDLKKDREIVLAAVKQSGFAVKYASEDLKEDPEIVLAAVKSSVFAHRYAAEVLNEDKEFMLTAMKHSKIAFSYASKDLKNDRDIVLAAVTQDSWALYHASDNLKEEPKIVLAAVMQDALALHHASAKLQGDPEIVLAAVMQNGEVLRYASKTLRSSEILKRLSPTELALKRLAWAKALKPGNDILIDDILILIGSILPTLPKSDTGELFNVLLKHLKKELELPTNKGDKRKRQDSEKRDVKQRIN